MKSIKIALVCALICSPFSVDAMAAAGGVSATVNKGQRAATVNKGQQAARVNHGQNKGGVVRGPGQANRQVSSTAQ